MNETVATENVEVGNFDNRDSLDEPKFSVKGTDRLARVRHRAAIGCQECK